MSKIKTAKQDFVDWKRHQVTEAVMENLQIRLDILKDELADSAGLDVLNDRYKAGYIAACRDFLNVSVEDVVDE